MQDQIRAVVALLQAALLECGMVQYREVYRILELGQIE